MTPNITRFPPIHPMNLFLRKSELTHFDNFGLLYGGVSFFAHVVHRQMTRKKTASDCDTGKIVKKRLGEKRPKHHEEWVIRKTTRKQLDSRSSVADRVYDFVDNDYSLKGDENKFEKRLKSRIRRNIPPSDFFRRQSSGKEGEYMAKGETLKKIRIAEKEERGKGKRKKVGRILGM